MVRIVPSATAVLGGSVAVEDPALRVLAAVLGDLLATTQPPLNVVLRHALGVLDADTATVSVSVDDVRVRVVAAEGELAGALLDRSYDLAGGAVGRVVRERRALAVGPPSPERAGVDTSRLGPVLLAPLPLPETDRIGVLGISRLRSKPPLGEADLAAVGAFAGLAGMALHLDEARAAREAVRLAADRDRLAEAFRSTAVHRLSAVSLSLTALSAYTEDREFRARLLDCGDQVDALLVWIRDTIYDMPGHGPG